MGEKTRDSVSSTDPDELYLRCLTSGGYTGGAYVSANDPHTEMLEDEPRPMGCSCLGVLAALGTWALLLWWLK